MKVVITGATGTIGKSLINKLLDSDAEILVLTHKKSDRNQIIPKTDNLKISYCEISEYTNFPVYEKYDVFFHFAWIGGNDRTNISTNMKSVQHSLDAVQLAFRLGCHTFIGAGSQAECGPQNVKISNDVNCHPVNAFGASKLYSSFLTRYECERLGLRHLWARILSVYGPYDRQGSMVISTINKFLKNEPASFTKGEQMWDFLYTEDAADALYLMAISGMDKSVYSVGSGHVRRLSEYIMIIKKITDTQSAMQFGAVPYNKNEVMYLCADITQLTHDTGWLPKTSFEDGIRKTIDYCKTTGLE